MKETEQDLDEKLKALQMENIRLLDENFLLRGQNTGLIEKLASINRALTAKCENLALWLSIDDKLRADTTQLKEALWFYADPLHWESKTMIVKDGGPTIAKDAIDATKI